MELSLGVIVQVVRLLSEGTIRPGLVLLPHPRIAHLHAYAQTFGCPCRFEQAHAAVRVASAALSRPLPKRNAMLSALVQDYLDMRYAKPAQAMTERVRALLRQLLGTRSATQEGIARMLAVHSRTLQRRLRDEGTSFDAIKDEVRRAMLEDLMRRPDVPALSQVAAMLGYAEQSALTRSCRRWFGVAPSALRSSAGRS